MCYIYINVFFLRFTIIRSAAENDYKLISHIYVLNLSRFAYIKCY